MDASTQTKPLRIAGAAKAAGVNVQTLHYYERRGLLHPARAGSAGYRSYCAADVTLVRAIKRAQALGFSLAEIDELLSIGDARDRGRTQALASAKLAELDEKISDLTRMRAALGNLMETCKCGGDLSTCSILDGLGTQ